MSLVPVSQVLPVDPRAAAGPLPARASRTRIVFVTCFLPLDENGFDRASHGLFMRMRMLLEAVEPLADELHVVSFVDSALAVDAGQEALARAALARRWGVTARVTLVPERPMPRATSALAHYLRLARSAMHDPDFGAAAGDAQADAVAALLGPDVVGVFVHRLGSMGPILGAGSRSRLPVVLDLDDIEHRKRARAIRALPMRPGKIAACLSLPALLAAEVRAVRNTRRTFVCSENDRRYLARFAGASRVDVLPNSVRFPVEAPPDPGTETMLFIGAFSYPPNVDAALHLVHRLWPRIRDRRPGARLLVAGPRPENIPGVVHPPPGVEILGFVDDIAALYAQVRVACCPILPIDSDSVPVACAVRVMSRTEFPAAWSAMSIWARA